jgi:alkanesulfonate monooxygenase SsuD/methylene tetrahydromethanopterin reductase-like flavin-dependent oxidoreductase (luciferase family)
VQQPHPPIWIGAGGERLTIPIAARQADVWHCFEPFDELPRKIAVFEQHLGEAGRDPSSVARAADLEISDPWEQVHARADALRDLGFHHLVVQWPAEGEGRVERFADELMPVLAG